MKRWLSIFLVSLLYLSLLTGCVETGGLNNDQPQNSELPDIRYMVYEVEEVVYEAPMYDFSIVAGENSPIYSISEDMQLSSQKEFDTDEKWTELGKLEVVELTKENFDELFHWDEFDASDIRKETVNVWQLIYSQNDLYHLYYVLQQKNGDVYLAYGYYDYLEKDDVHSDDTHIRWLFKLKKGDISQIGGVDGPTNVSSEKRMTIDDVYELSAKKEQLTWEDLKGFSGRDIGSGLYVMRYDIDSEFYLLVGASGPVGTPMYARLCCVHGDQNVDIMTGDVKEFVDSYRPTPLDCAIMDTIAEYYHSDKPDGLIHTQGYVVLNKEVVSGTPLQGETTHVENITVYLLVRARRYSVSQGELSAVSGGALIPTKIRFSVSDESYLMEEYWTPTVTDQSTGSFAEDEVWAKFPEETAQEALYYNKYRDQLDQICDSKALFYLSEQEDASERPLKEKYPQYYGLETDQGLEVYVYQMAAKSYSCVLVSSKGVEYTWDELPNVPSASMEEMRTIVQSYRLDRSEISIIPIRMPYSSYWYEIDDTYRATLDGLFWAEYTDLREPVFSSVFDSVSFDVDKDGKKEVCTLSYGPTSGLFSFTFIVHPDDPKVSGFEYYQYFVLGRAYELSFDVADGVLRIRGDWHDSSEKPVYFDIDICDGKIQLRCDEDEIFVNNPR